LYVWLKSVGCPIQVLFSLSKGSFLFPFAQTLIRATASKYGESDDRTENSNFLLLCQKDPLSKLFRNIFKRSGKFTFWWNLRKVRNTAQSSKMADGILQNCAFSTGYYRKKGTCLDFIFTQFVIYALIILWAQNHTTVIQR